MMKKHILLATTLLALTGTASAAGSFTLQADDLQNGSFTRKQLLSAEYGFGCTGNNQSPALSWKNAPVGTRSFLLTSRGRGGGFILRVARHRCAGR